MKNVAFTAKERVHLAQQLEQPIYRNICTVYTSPDGERVWTYGIEMVSGERVIVFPDVDLSSAAVDRLIDRLRACEVEPCHFRDAVLDYIEERATL